MSGIFGGSKSTQTSTPVDLTPEAFKNLQGPLAQQLLSLFSGNIPAYGGSPGAVLGPGLATSASGVPGGPRVPTTGSFPRPLSTRPATQPDNREDRFAIQQLRGRLGLDAASGSANPFASAGARLKIDAPNQPIIPQASGAPGTMPGAAGEADLVAQMTPDQQAILNQIVQSTLAGGANTAASQQMLGNTIGGQFLTPDSNPFLAATIEAAQRPLKEQFEQSIVPQLLSRFAAAGQQVQGTGSSAFANQANLAASQQGRALGDVATAISSENYQKERDRQIAATQQSSAISTDELNRTVTGFEQAALPQLIKDLGIQRGLEQFNKRLEVLMEALRLAGGVASPTVATSSSGKSATSPDFSGLITAGLFGV